MTRPRRNTAAAAVKVDTAETVQAVKEESGVCAAGEKGAVSAAGQKKSACVAEEKYTTHEAGRTVVVEFAGKPRRPIWQPTRMLKSRPWSFIFHQSRMQPTMW